MERGEIIGRDCLWEKTQNRKRLKGRADIISPNIAVWIAVM